MTDITPEQLDQAIRIFQREKKVAQICLQLHLRVKYDVATSIIEKLETDGRITAQDKTGKRRVAETAPSIGHNSGDAQVMETPVITVRPADADHVAGQRLKSYLDRVDRLEEEKKGIADDIKDIYAEAKGVGFDTKAIKKLVKLRRMDTNKRHEEEEILELYKAAVGLI